jgi:glutaminyl-peptide cyclotransferase
VDSRLKGLFSSKRAKAFCSNVVPKFVRHAVLCAVTALVGLTGCKAKSDEVRGASSRDASASAGKAATSASGRVSAGQGGADEAPPPEQTGGFDGKRAFEHVAKQVNIGARPSGSQANLATQDYILTQLKSYGCTADVDPFNADTPVGIVPMKNILVKIPGDDRLIILLGTHYDTLPKKDFVFVGADDGGSSTGVMLELARILCGRHGKHAVWIAFFDGEEAMKSWSDRDSRYGSRQMAARFAASGDLARIKAFLLADLVGSRTLHFARESNSTPWLVDLVWNTAARLGYGDVFINATTSVEDDHDSFLRRNVASVDVIDLDRAGDVAFWHTAEDTLDKISGMSLAITGHVFLESVKELQKR